MTAALGRSELQRQVASWRLHLARLHSGLAQGTTPRPLFGQTDFLTLCDQLERLLGPLSDLRLAYDRLAGPYAGWYLSNVPVEYDPAETTVAQARKQVRAEQECINLIRYNELVDDLKTLPKVQRLQRITMRSRRLIRAFDNIDARLGSTETQLNVEQSAVTEECCSPRRSASKFNKLRAWASDTLKKGERAAIEHLCDAGGRMTLANLGFDLKWQGKSFDDKASSLYTRLNKKLKKHCQPWRVKRHENAFLLVPKNGTDSA